MEIIAVLGYLLLLTLLGLLVAFNPMLIVVDILLVLKTRRPILNSLILAGGFVSSLLAILFIAGLVMDPEGSVSLRQLSDSISIPPLIDLAAGLLLIIYVAKRYIRVGPLPSPKTFKIENAPDKPLPLFIFSFVKTALSLTNLFVILLLAKALVTNSWSLLVSFAAIAWVIIIGLMPIAMIVYYHEFKHESLVAVEKRIDGWMSKDTTKLINYGLLIIGIFLAAKGAFGILIKG